MHLFSTKSAPSVNGRVNDGVSGAHLGPSGRVSTWLIGCLMILGNLHCLSAVGDWTGLDCDATHPCKSGYECYALTQTCVEVFNFPVGPGTCVQQSDCLYDEPGKIDGYCHFETHICLPCLVDAHCQFGVCHPTAFQCLNCIEDSDCPPAKHCDLQYYECTDEPVSETGGILR